jgi:FkbM family methyltransferase
MTSSTNIQLVAKIGKIGKINKLIAQDQPVRFLASRLLWHSRLCSLFTVQCNSYRVRFYPSSYSAMLWLDPKERLTEELFLCELLHKDDQVIDVGANIGSISLAAAKIIGTDGKVYSIEAHPRTYKYLLGNLRLNRMANVVPINVACGDRTGTVLFSNKTSDDQNVISTEGMVVPMQRLDELVPGDKQIALLKIDVEGYERFVLQGASNLLPRVKYIYFESYEQHYTEFGYKLRDVIDFLKNFHFTVYHLNGQPVAENYNSLACENLLAKRE